MNSKKHTTIILKGETRQSANRFHDGVFRGNDDKTRKCYSIISSFFNNRYAFYFLKLMVTVEEHSFIMHFRSKMIT
jgi:hypothetical protein